MRNERINQITLGTMKSSIYAGALLIIIAISACNQDNSGSKSQNKFEKAMDEASSQAAVSASRVTGEVDELSDKINKETSNALDKTMKSATNALNNVKDKVQELDIEASEELEDLTEATEAEMEVFPEE